MDWLILLVFGVIWLVYKSQSTSQRKGGRQGRAQPFDTGGAQQRTQPLGITFTIETTDPQPYQPLSPEEEEKREEQKRKDWDERERNAIPWCSDTSLKPPIKALTINQSYCLKHARVRYVIVNEGPDWLPKFPDRKSVKPHAKRTINSLLKHQMLEAVGDGSYRITNMGLRALELLPIRYD